MSGAHYTAEVFRVLGVPQSAPAALSAISHKLGGRFTGKAKQGGRAVMWLGPSQKCIIVLDAIEDSSNDTTPGSQDEDSGNDTEDRKQLANCTGMPFHVVRFRFILN